MIISYPRPHTYSFQVLPFTNNYLQSQVINGFLLPYASRYQFMVVGEEINQITTQYGYNVRYNVSWFGLRVAWDLLAETWENFMQKLLRYMAALKQQNISTVVEWEFKGERHPMCLCWRMCSIVSKLALIDFITVV